MVRWVIRSILHVVNPLSYFLFQPVLHDWCNKGCGMCYPVCGMVHIKEPLLLIIKNSLCGGSGFPFSLSEWSLTICLTPYNHKENVLSVSLNKTFPSFRFEFPWWFSDFILYSYSSFIVIHGNCQILQKLIMTLCFYRYHADCDVMPLSAW